jgi:hypothetical protein
MKKLTPSEARQGVTGQKVRYVLAASLSLAVIAMIAVGKFFQ